MSDIVDLLSEADFKSVKSKLFLISDLEIPVNTVLEEDKLISYVNNTLIYFIQAFPKKEELINDALKKQDYQALSKVVADLCHKLKVIHANELAKDCEKQMEKLSSMKHEKIQAYMAFFLTAVSMLSIDIQMAVYKAPDIVNKADESLNETGKRSISILAVDDEPFILQALEAALSGTEYKLTGVNSGMAALRYLEKHHPDLFILDIEMPAMNGYELAQKIKENNQCAPIIFLTGNSKKEYVMKAIRVGASDFILKPIDREIVIKRIGKFI